MPKGWSKVVDSSEQVQYEHDDGGFVVANKRERGNWVIKARVGFGSEDLGRGYAKQEAIQRMNQFMRKENDARENQPARGGAGSFSGGGGLFGSGPF